MTVNRIDLKERIAISDAYSPDERMFLLNAVNAMPDDDDRIEKHSPRNYMGRIERIWAFLSIDDGGEGVCAAPIGGMTLPLIAADWHRLVLLRPYAQTVVKMFRRPVRLACFRSREDVEIIQP
jgi:hypothetical protein